MEKIKCETCQRDFDNIKGRSVHYRFNKKCYDEYIKRKEEIENTSTKTKIECKLCHKKMRYISNTHLKNHNITQKQYKEMFPGEKLFAEDLLEEQLKNRISTINRLYPNNEHAKKSWEASIKKYGSKEAASKIRSDSCKKVWENIELKEKQSFKIKSFYEELSKDEELHKKHKEERLNKRKETSRILYGVDFPQQAEIVKQHQKETLIKNYGSLPEAYAEIFRTKLQNKIKNGEELIYPCYSKNSQKLFKFLDRCIKNKQFSVFYATKKDKGKRIGEYRIQVSIDRLQNNGVIFRFLDFYILELNKVIEYDENHHKNFIQEDLERENQIKIVCENIKILRITEEEFLKNKKETMKKCLNFIFE